MSDTKKQTFASNPLKALVPGTDAYASRKAYNAEWNGDRKAAVAAPMGTESTLKRREAAAGLKNGGMVKVGKGSTPYKCK